MRKPLLFIANCSGFFLFFIFYRTYSLLGRTSGRTFCLSWSQKYFYNQPSACAHCLISGYLTIKFFVICYIPPKNNIEQEETYGKKKVEKNIARDEERNLYYVTLFYGTDQSGKKIKKTKTTRIVHNTQQEVCGYTEQLRNFDDMGIAQLIGHTTHYHFRFSFRIPEECSQFWDS